MSKLFARISQGFNRVANKNSQRSFHTAHFDTYEEGKKVFHHNTNQFLALFVGVMIIGPVYLFWSESKGVMPKTHYIWGEKPQYMNVRRKPFPWKCYDCSLFDTACHERCKREDAEKKAAWERLQKH
jgi:hypothetical protein